MASYVKWYYFFNGNQRPGTRYQIKALKDAYSSEQLCHMIIISQDTNTGRRYTAFDSYFDLYDYMKELDLEEKFLHEMCLGGIVQKPRFDIDMKHSELPPDVDIGVYCKNVLEIVMECCLELICEAGIVISESKEEDTISIGELFSLCTSHGKNKHSYHVVLNKVAHRHSEEARGFYDKVIEKAILRLPEISKWIDSGIYSNNHSLRLLGSLKLDDDDVRMKVPVYPIVYKGVEYKCDSVEQAYYDNEILSRVILERSLVSWVHDFTMLPNYAPVKEERPTCPDVDSEELRIALDYLEKDLEGEQPFEVAYVKGSLIALRRKTDSSGKKIPSYCKKCNVIHEAENPFLIVSNGYVTYHCRRTKSGRVLKEGRSRFCDDILSFIHRRIKKNTGRDIEEILVYNVWAGQGKPETEIKDDLDDVHTWAVEKFGNRIEQGYSIVINKDKYDVYTVFAESEIGLAHKVCSFTHAQYLEAVNVSYRNVSQVDDDEIEDEIQDVEVGTVDTGNRFVIEEDGTVDTKDRFIIEETGSTVGQEYIYGAPVYYTKYQSFPGLPSFSNDEAFDTNIQEEEKKKDRMLQLYESKFSREIDSEIRSIPRQNVGTARDSIVRETGVTSVRSTPRQNVGTPRDSTPRVSSSGVNNTARGYTRGSKRY